MKRILLFPALMLLTTRGLAAPPTYTLTDLGTLGAYGQFHDMNNHGQIVGEEETGPLFTDRSAVMWEAGVRTYLGTLGGANSAAWAINDLGLIVGIADSPTSPEQPVRWLASRPDITELDLFAGIPNQYQLRGINGAETAVGWVCCTTPLKWNGVTVEEITPGGLSPWGINEAGDIFGDNNVGGDPHAAVLVGTTLHDLHPGGSESFALDVNASREVVGRCEFLSSVTDHACYWPTLTSPAVNLSPGSTYGGAAIRINDAGDIVGYIRDSTGVPNATLWQGGVAHDLNSLIKPVSGLHLHLAEAIDQAGKILVQGELLGVERWYLLSPSAEIVPLGTPVATGGSGSAYRVYVPSKYGGDLTLTTSAGTIGDIAVHDRPLGLPPQSTQVIALKNDSHGWVTFRVTGASTYTISNSFIEEAEADTTPWNFWYFPFSSARRRLHLYDDPGAYRHWDERWSLGGAGLAWEEANHRDQPGAESWWGHCWGATVASIVLQQPFATGAFTTDELEGLAAEFFDDKDGQILEALFAPEGQSIKPSPDPDQSIDETVNQFHRTLVRMLLVGRRAFHADLQAGDGIGIGEVWNQACYYYRSELKQDPNAAGDPETEKPRQVHIRTTLRCNDDFLDSSMVSYGNPRDAFDARREQVSEYVLIYNEDGELVANQALAGRRQNWLSMKVTHLASKGDVDVDAFAPYMMTDVSIMGAHYSTPTTPGDNPNILAGQLLDLGLVLTPGF